MTDTVDVAATEVPEFPLDDKEVNLKFTVKEINVLLNILNRPVGIDTITLAKLIDMIQVQCAPQIDILLKDLENDEPKATA